MIGRIVRLIGEAKCYPYKITSFEFEDRDQKLLFSIQREDGLIRKVNVDQIVLDPDKYTVYNEIKEFCGRLNLELKEFNELDSHEYKITLRKF
ncbi:MAG: hypothetical protein WC373_11730 [Smithella sp.]|jgi:hypothetical protein